MATPSDLLPRWLVDHHTADADSSLQPPAHLQLQPWNDGFTPSGCNNRPGKMLVSQPRATRDALRVVDGAVAPATADLIYASAVRAKVWGVFVRTSELSLGNQHDTDALRAQLALQDETLMDKDAKAQYRQTLARLAVQEFLVAQGADVIRHEDWSRAHGVAVWVIASDCDDETEYHLDYAEMLRYETNVIFPPIYGATLHVSPLADASEASATATADVGTLEGGGFFVNTRGLDHYKQYGYKTRVASSQSKLTTDALEQLTKSEPGWTHVPYKYRRGIICDGDYPHFSGRVRALPMDSHDAATPRVKRVVVGFNLFPQEIGDFVERFPEHSDAFNKYVKLSQTALKQPQQWSLESLKKNPKQAAFLKFLARKVKEKQAQQDQVQAASPVAS